jgi:exosortase C (VPDSG-CTERM-specific)
MISNSAEAAWSELPRSQRVRLAGAVSGLAVLTLLFIDPLADLVRLASRDDLHSHIPLVPFVAAYVLYIQHKGRAIPYRTSLLGAIALAVIGAAAVAAALIYAPQLSAADYLAVMMLGYVSLISSVAFAFLGSEWMSASAFPMAFLLFMIPLPDAAVRELEMASARASADVSALLFTWTGTPLLRDGMLFTLPGIVIEVARECSGIRSSWVLFITSVLAAHLFLVSPWRRLLLIAFVIPLGIVRNAIRILTIGLLSVHIGPHMADSVIHRRGGPLFFALSLIPLFLVMWWLWRQEHRGAVRG